MESEKNEVWERKRLEELKDGDSVITPGGDISKQEIPEWFDEQKFQRAKEIYRDHFAAINFSHLCGLLLSFYFTKNIKTLLSTGESSSKNALFHRYLMTIRHIQKWYEGNVWDVNDPAHRSISIVRSMHARIGQKMAALNDGIVYVSQWDMAITQWAFVGPIVLFRSRVGLHGCSDEDYDAVIHFWRTIGYLLGIEDKYNLCQGTYDQVVRACEGVLHKEYKVRIIEADPLSVRMGKSVVEAMHMMDELLTWPSLSTYIHELADIPCPDTMGLVDWICHNLMRFMMLYVLKVERCRPMFNDLVRWRLDKADQKDLELMKGLRRSNNPSTVNAG